MKTTHLLSQLPLEEVLALAHQESRRFVHHQPTESMYIWELFRRAIALRDEGSWGGIYELFENLVWSWLLHSQSKLQSLSHDDLPDLVNEVFAKFARSVSAERLPNFATAPALLAYLKCCAWSVLVDADRQARHRTSNEEPLEQAFLDEPIGAGDPADGIADREGAQHLWHLLLQEMRTYDERLVLYSLCVTHVPPRELLKQYPTIFASVDDVYRIKRNVVERLRRSRVVRAWQVREEAVA